MSLWGTLRDEGRAARRGVTTLFLVTGAALAYWWNAYGPDYLRLVLGFFSIAVGIGVWRNWRWARWLALGSCFLSIVVAFAMPVLLVLWRPFEEYGEGSTQIALFTCAAAGAVAVIGYKGLGYFRSAAAWRAYSTNDRERKALAGESSAKVVKSAAVVAILMGLIAVERGVGMPSPPTPMPAPAGQLPDLVVNSLCMDAQDYARAELQNRGTGKDSHAFKMTFSDLLSGRGLDSFLTTVPAPGQSIYVALTTSINLSQKEGIKLLHVVVDSSQEIRESNENNNTADFEIFYHNYHPVDLPRCP